MIDRDLILIKRKFAPTVLLIFLLTGNLAADVEVGKYAGEFMATGVGARALGMGAAYTAVTDNISSVYWNPAGLAFMTSFQAEGMHAERFSGTVNRDFVGAGLPVRRSTFIGFGFLRLGVDGIPITQLQDSERAVGEIFLNESGQRVQNTVYAEEYVNDNEMAFLFSVAKKHSKKLSLGANVKIIRKAAGDYGAWGIGFDAGAIYQPGESLRLAAVLVDGTSTLVAWSSGTQELILPQVRLGAARLFRWRQFAFYPALDAELSFENRGDAEQIALGRMGIAFREGLEMTYKKVIALRVGMDKDRFTAGAGFRMRGIGVDYGFIPHVDLGTSHRISLSVFWDGLRN